MTRSTRYRFRTPSDRKLLESILLHKPYAAPYGSKAAKWNNICADLTAFELSNAQYRENKADQLTARACRNRFKILKVDYPLRYGKYCTAEQKEVLALLDLLQYEVRPSSSSRNGGSTGVMPQLVGSVSGVDHHHRNETNANPSQRKKKKTAMEFILNSAPSDDCMEYYHSNSIDEEDGDTTSNDSHDSSLPSDSRYSRSSSNCSSDENFVQGEDEDLEENDETLSLQDVLREFEALRRTISTLIETKKRLHHDVHHAIMVPPVHVPSYSAPPAKSRMMIPPVHQQPLPSNLYQHHLSIAPPASSLGPHRVIQ